MKPFFKTQTLEQVHDRARQVGTLEAEDVPLGSLLGRTLARDFVAPHDLPGFARSTMDGYAVRSLDTFGAGEGSPAYLTLSGEVAMGEEPCVAAVVSHGCKLGEQWLGSLGRSFECLFGLCPNFFQRAHPATHLHSYSCCFF